MRVDYEETREELKRVLPNVTKEIENTIKTPFDKCGLYYKCFCRIKTAESILDKLKSRYKDGKKGYKLQDLIGVRIVVYFKRDIPLCEKIISNNFIVENISKDEEEEKVFKPQRINYVCYMPEKIMDIFDEEVWKFPIDKTFEIQIRTIFSEGWHEVEHDFRYKCLEEWEDNLDLSRTLNGVLATLDNCDWAIENLLNQLAYRHYKKKEWIPMLKNVFKMKISDEEGMDDIIRCFEENNVIGKMFLRLDREDFMIKLSFAKSKFPMRLSTLVYIANYIEIQNKKLLELTPKLIIDKCIREFGEIKRYM